MNTQARRRKVNIGVAYLAEVILDVINEEEKRTNAEVSTNKINQELEFKENWEARLCRSVLDHMEDNKEIVNVGGASWRLNS